MGNNLGLSTSMLYKTWCQLRKDILFIALGRFFVIEFISMSECHLCQGHPYFSPGYVNFTTPGLVGIAYTCLREGWLYQMGWIFGKIPNGLRPRSSFSKIILQIFIMDNLIRLHIYKEVWGPDSMKYVHMMCLVLIFLNTIVEKTYAEPWNDSFVSIPCSKSQV